jgi:hypothetical protein
MQGKVPCDTRLSEILIAGRVGGRLTGSIEKNEPATWGVNRSAARYRRALLQSGPMATEGDAKTPSPD